MAFKYFKKSYASCLSPVLNLVSPNLSANMLTTWPPRIIYMLNVLCVKLSLQTASFSPITLKTFNMHIFHVMTYLPISCNHFWGGWIEFGIIFCKCAYLKRKKNCQVLGSNLRPSEFYDNCYFESNVLPTALSCTHSYTTYTQLYPPIRGSVV